MTPRRRALATAAYAAALAALCLLTAVFRFLLLPSGFTNDHFLFVAGGQQMLFGEWPTRDFLDPGLPLMFGASAAAHWLFGPTLFAEAMLVSVAFAIAAALTAATVRAMTGSRLLALLAVLFEVAIVTRTYSYPKILAYAAGFFMIQRFVTRPTTARLIALAAVVACAFLFRHDHGVNLAIGGLLATLLVPADTAEATPRASARFGWSTWRRPFVFVAAVALFTAPYLVYVQVYTGLITYVRRGIEFGSTEVSRQPLVWPSLFGDRAAEAVIVYTYWTLPILAMLLALGYLRRGADGMTAGAERRRMAARVIPIAVVALLVTSTLVRHELAARLPDGIVPAVVVGAWLTACAWTARRRWVLRPLAILLIVVVGRSVMTVADTPGEIRRAGMHVSWGRLPEFVRETSARLRSPSAQGLTASRPSAALLPFYPYLERCARRDDRLLLVGFIPEVAFFAHRPFAGGMPVFLPPYYSSEADQRLVLERLGRQRVPFVVIPGGASEFRETYPLVAAHVSSRYEPFATLSTDPEFSVQVLIDRTMTVSPRDPETGWPCIGRG